MEQQPTAKQPASAEQETPESATMTPSESTTAAKPKTSKIKKIINIILLVLCAMFVFHLVADRFIPSTDLARVRAFVVPIAPQVSADVIDILAKPNQLVSAGDVLVKLDPTDFEIALKQAEEAVEQAKQGVGAQTAGIASAQARVGEAQANLVNAQSQYKRIATLADKGVVSQADKDNAKAALSSARAGVASAKAELEKVKEQLGETGEDNSQLQSALLALEKAQVDLSRTSIVAPSDGGVSNFKLEVGYRANVGQPLMTFISMDSVWVEAYFRENSLGNLKPGDEVEIALDYAPGRVFSGKVSHIDYGIDWGQSEQAGKLAQIKSQSSWLRDTQRFPMTIVFSDEEAKGMRRVGGQADVIVYSEDATLLRPIGKVWIRFLSWLSYVR
ncbi:HlyD family secretion protein [Motilimonas sp. 1_MG-2023]|uniref:HlyD family secretion protein n=1 Tax=Motilimonas sp. 1_MG-2023 TaxID=3062672 RepID=UPI0026E1A826|nr:HlyD family secretion protein [Motilimonas sp. 1_MG-2023]MDO6528023.1 HlyD family secretion protein [Motilimonas sp. 1_MG-2023]